MLSPEGLNERDAGRRWKLRPSPLVSFGLQHGSGKSDTLSRSLPLFPPEHACRKRGTIDRARGGQQCMSTSI